MAIRDRPLPSLLYEDRRAFHPRAGSVYLYGRSVEDRSIISGAWAEACKEVEFVAVIAQAPDHFSWGADEPQDVSLRSSQGLGKFWERFAGRSVYLDVTGLGHHVWAPLTRAALNGGVRLRVVYEEPLEYRFSAAPTEGEIFDLSEKISGISPIPGFASLTDVRGDDVCFVPLLGFEGARLAYLIEQVQPPGGKIVPVVGVPGFRPEYPFYAYHGNRSVLAETRAWKNIRFAIAHCPFSLFHELEDISRDHPRELLKIAPIGTKPHALGAVLYAVVSGRRVELVYDHPIRKARRTVGNARVLLYDVAAFVQG